MRRRKEIKEKQIKENFSQGFSDLCPENLIQVLAVYWSCDLRYVTRSLWAGGEVHTPPGRTHRGRLKACVWQQALHSTVYTPGDYRNEVSFGFLFFQFHNRKVVWLTRKTLEGNAETKQNETNNY